MKKGFTFVETMVATMAMGIVLGALLSSFVATQRMLRLTMAESELSIAARQLREKLLFHAAPPIDGVTYAGILSGTNANSVVEGGASPNIQMSCSGIGSSLLDVRMQSMRIMMWGASASHYLLNEHIPDKDAHAGWLKPGGLFLADDSISEVVSYDVADGEIYRLHININLKANVRDPSGADVIRRERIAVPVFGRLQPFQDAGGNY